MVVDIILNSKYQMKTAELTMVIQIIRATLVSQITQVTQITQITQVTRVSHAYKLNSQVVAFI